MGNQEDRPQKPAGPTAAKRFLDQQVLPVAIDAVAMVEQWLEYVSVFARGRPAMAVVLATGAGMVLGVGMTRKRFVHRRRRWL